MANATAELGLNERVRSADNLGARTFGPQNNAMKILVAEDDAVSGAILRAQLTKLGHEPVVVADGLAALAHYEREPTEIIISDWVMPGLNGLELCAAIRKLNLRNYTHFILQTSNTTEAGYQEAMAAGVDDYLPKPMARGELYNRLRVAERMIRQRREANQTIDQLARFPEDNPNPVLQLSENGVVRYANQAARHCLGDREMGAGRLAPPALRGLVGQLFECGTRQEVELGLEQRVFSFAATSILDGGGTYVYGHDITDRKQAELEVLRLKDEAVRQALHDPLTGLPNRLHLATRLAQARAQAQRQGRGFALLMIDIDNFKSVNDGLGHEAGDRLIVLVGHTLRDQLRGTDCLCRWGGDEMVLLLTEVQGAEAVAATGERLRRAVTAAVEAGQFNVPISVSIGFALYPQHSEDQEILMQQADQALYDAKRAGRNCLRPFTGFPAGQVQKSTANLLFRLGNAVREDRLTVQYQPLIEGTTGRPVALEALARWHDEELGRVPPDQFIPLAEEQGLIVELGAQVLAKTLAVTRAAHDRGWVLQPAVNISRRQLMSPGFAEQVAAAAAAHRIDPESLILEITEREAFADNPDCQRGLRQLDALGFRLALDDFGAGYSTFELLCELPFKELKLNLGLIQRLPNPRVAQVVRAIVEMARGLELVVVAEGVETPAQRDFLAGIGVHKLQGYLFSQPLDPPALEAYLRQHLPTGGELAA